ncbi:MAG TPA: hypothetical protein GXX75_14230 [Clostridiales bacterium]|nr:hypothetical protein [Clostridiales bacterium]
METIKSYLDNMFAGLPKTARVLDLKGNILSNMEEKYYELKNQGKSENEAIGIVISEFGNIDELVTELGIRQDEQAANEPVVTREEVEAYLSIKKSMGQQIGIGVFLCILAAAMLILLSSALEVIPGISEAAADAPGIIALLVLVTIAVGIFIYSGMKFEQYKYMEKGVQLPTYLEVELKQRYDQYNPVFYLHLIIGVGILILSPISLFVSSLFGDRAENYGVVILMFLVACSVYLFISSGTVRESYSRLLKLGDYSEQEKHKKEDKVIGAVAAIVWPLATAVFLFCGFVYGLWHIAWIVFPITGILFGMFSAAYSIITDKN